MAPVDDVKAAELTPASTAALASEAAASPSKRSPAARKAKAAPAPNKDERAVKAAPTKAKKSKANKPSVSKNLSDNGPSYFDLIAAAIREMKERNGTSRQAIARIVEAKKENYASHHLNKALRTAVETGKLIQIKGSYKLSPELRKPVVSSKKSMKVSDSSPKTVTKVAKVTKKMPGKKKIATKKIAAKKVDAKKTPAKKNPTKASAMKSATKKVAPKKVVAKKSVPKNVSAKSTKKTGKNTAKK